MGAYPHYRPHHWLCGRLVDNPASLINSVQNKVTANVLQTPVFDEDFMSYRYIFSRIPYIALKSYFIPSWIISDLIWRVLYSMSILWYQIHSTDTLFSYNCPQRPSFQHSSPLPSRAILSMNALKGHFLTQLCTALLERSFYDYLQSHSRHHCPLLSLYRANISMIAFQSNYFFYYIL